MKFCKNCGTAVDKNDKICVVCGAKIDEESEKNINESVIADSAEKQNVINSETEEPQMQVNDIEVNKSENKPQAQ
ncbi:MAG: zinc ribbon domain-containing protein, partial [Ruminococcaceae bacterium]|nr:zinc ribbon domain-containing protein [Oscillospiraceae bacterium]